MTSSRAGRGTNLRPPVPVLSWPRRLGAWFTVAVMLAGCGVLWVGIPIGCFWLAGELTKNAGYHAPLALLMIAPAMFAWAVLLAWINDIWLSITGGEIVLVRDVPVRRKGPLEVLLPVCGVIALIALVIWFFVAAENPSSQFL